MEKNERFVRIPPFDSRRSSNGTRLSLATMRNIIRGRRSAKVDEWVGGDLTAMPPPSHRHGYETTQTRHEKQFKGKKSESEWSKMNTRNVSE